MVGSEARRKFRGGAVRLKGAIAVEFVGCAVEVVGPGLNREIDHSRAGASVIGTNAYSLQFESLTDSTLGVRSVLPPFR